MKPTFTEDDYYEMIDAALNDEPGAGPLQWPSYPMDCVASPQEWLRFKAALSRWLERMDAECRAGFDQAALEREYEPEDQ